MTIIENYDFSTLPPRVFFNFEKIVISFIFYNFLWFRTKRQTDSWFLAPNTKWCGKGRSAEMYKELGPSKGDVCCRKHDHCKMYIAPFQSKFGVFNRSPFAMSHCRCDRRLDSINWRHIFHFNCHSSIRNSSSQVLVNQFSPLDNDTHTLIDFRFDLGLMLFSVALEFSPSP